MKINHLRQTKGDRIPTEIPSCILIGLVSHVVSDTELPGKARAIAAEIAANAPLAVQSSKRMMRMSANETFDTHVQHVFLQHQTLRKSADAREGMLSFLEKRKPNFEGR